MPSGFGNNQCCKLYFMVRQNREGNGRRIYSRGGKIILSLKENKEKY